MYEGEKEAMSEAKESLFTHVASIDKGLRDLCERVEKLHHRFNDLCSQIGIKI